MPLLGQQRLGLGLARAPLRPKGQARMGTNHPWHEESVTEVM